MPGWISSLAKVFDTPTWPYTAVKDFRAKFEFGEFVSLLGHTGCGKSTVLAIVAGLQEHTEGGVMIDGRISNARWSSDRHRCRTG